MAFKIVGQLKDSIAGILTGTNLNNVTNLNGAIERAVRVMAQEVDVPESSDRQSLMLYNGVYDYPAPLSIFGGAINDLRPQGMGRTPLDVVYKNDITMFDTTKAFLPNGYQTTFEFRKGVGIMRVAQVKAQIKAEIDTMTDTTGWTASGDASGLTTDQTVYWKAPASLRFNLAASGSQGLLTKTLTSTDLSSYIGTGVIFLAIYTPNATALTSIAVRLGSDASNYIEITETEGFLGAWTANNWLLVALDTSVGTTTGVPDYTKVTYTRVAINYDGTAMPNFRVGDLFISLPSPHELLFQTASIFKVGETLSNTITDDNDEIILNDAAYTLLEYEGAQQVCFQMGGDLSSGSLATIKSILHGAGNDLGLYARYRADNPSQEVRLTGAWY